MKKYLPQLITFLLILNPIIIYAEIDTTDVSLFDRSIEELIEQEVTIATKSNQKLSQTPSVVSVITSEEINAMGYRDLNDVLQTIPGFEVSQTRMGAKPIGIRGVSDIRQGGRLLVLLDGEPYNDIMYSSALFYGATFNLDAVKKIEVIRGPGSALYGRNAFSGVVNIITKKAESDNNIEVGASYGSYNTADVRAAYNIKKEKINANITAKYLTSDGTDSKYNNGEGGESIWNLTHNNLYLNANAEYKGFQFYGSYAHRIDGTNTATKFGDFITNGSSEFKIGTYSLAYKYDVASNTSMQFKLYGKNEFRFQDFELTTPNTTDLHPSGIPFNDPLAYPQGGYAEPIFDAYTYGAEIEFSRQLHKNNRLLTGIQGDMHGVKDASVRSNYDLSTSRTIVDPETGQQYTKEEMPIYEPGWILNGGHDYQNVALYVQDVHYFMDNLSITAGFRFDIDSEIGNSINPRIGLVWEPTKESSIKVLYGKAYRAPNTNEQYKIMGADMGNENLDQEEINTAEIVFAYQFDRIYTQLSFYYNVLDNLILQQNIDTISNIKSYFNTGQNISYGFEFDSKYKINSRFYGFANYSYNQSEDTKNIFEQEVVSPHANVSTHKFNIGINTKIHQKINWSILLRYKSNIQKFLNPDPNVKYISQDKVGDFFMLNSTILLTDLLKGFDLSIQGYNLLNTEYFYQDDTFAHQPKQKGAHFLLRARYNFNL